MKSRPLNAKIMTGQTDSRSFVAVRTYAQLALVVMACFLSSHLLAQPGTLDQTFNSTDTGWGNGTNSSVHSVFIQPDGKIVFGGLFSIYKNTVRNRLARVESNGTLDASFDVGSGPNDDVWAIADQSDGKLIVGGVFTTFNGVSKSRIARLNTDGSLDGSFNIGSGANGIVRAIVRQPDGKILVGGEFTSFNGTARNRIARLNSDGTVDLTFAPSSGANGSVRSILYLPDGKIYVAGLFTQFNGSTQNRIVKLNSDGSTDPGFSPGTAANNNVLDMDLQADGKIVIVGDFTNYNGTAESRVARINSDGTLDATFNTGTGSHTTVASVICQADGKTLIAGPFFFFNGNFLENIIRLNSNGSIDFAFNAQIGRAHV